MELLGVGRNTGEQESVSQEKGKTKGRTFRGRSIWVMGFEPAIVSERPSGPPG
jgi:hypothetical protein